MVNRSVAPRGRLKWDIFRCPVGPWSGVMRHRRTGCELQAGQSNIIVGLEGLIDWSAEASIGVRGTEYTVDAGV
jgi:hypothetical protein